MHNIFRKASKKEIDRFFSRKALKLYELILFSFEYLPLPLEAIESFEQSLSQRDIFSDGISKIGDLFMRARTAIEIGDLKTISEGKPNKLSRVMITRYFDWLKTQIDIKIPKKIEKGVKRVKDLSENTRPDRDADKPLHKSERDCYLNTIGGLLALNYGHQDGKINTNPSQVHKEIIENTPYKVGVDKVREHFKQAHGILQSS